jgi:16S rRNA (adenine1518-N6/adenine1519-N6)-dimethyltransferase
MNSGSADTGGSPKKSLGQHWLRDETVLREIAGLLEIGENDTILEIGPGQGALTKYLLGKAKKVIAVELDKDLAKNLLEHKTKLYKVRPCNSEFCVLNEDFLKFDLSSLPAGYKVVGNIPYYITGKIIQKCLQASNKPSRTVLLVQKEVAERIAAPVGRLSILGAISQFYADVSLGPVVTADKFDPPPKVDSQVVVLKPYNNTFSSYRGLSPIEEKCFIKIVKAGFSAKRKKLKTALAGGLGIEKSKAEELLSAANINPNLRAQDLSMADWKSLVLKYQHDN